MKKKQEKIRALEVLDAYYPTWDGPTILVTNYAKCMLKRDDCDGEVMVPKYPKYKDNQPFPVHRIFSVGVPKAEHYRCVLPALQRKSKKVFFRKDNPFSIVHVHSPFLMADHAIKLAKKKGVPSVITMHTRFEEDFDRILKSKGIKKFLMNFTLNVYKKADYVVCVSDGTAETLRGYGYDKDNVRVIRNGTDLTYPKNAEALKEAVRKKEGLSDTDNVLLSVGRVVENKKLDLAVKALKIVKEHGVPFTYVIVGAGTYEEKLKKHVLDAGLSENVKFAGRIMDRDELAGYYLSSDLFIFPSTYDTASLAPIEAAAMKLPLLMTKGCSTAEIIEDGETGFLADETPEAWAKRIEEILADKERLSAVKENAHEKVYRSWDSVVDEVVDYYRWCIDDFNAKKAKTEKKK